MRKSYGYIVEKLFNLVIVFNKNIIVKFATVVNTSLYSLNLNNLYHIFYTPNFNQLTDGPFNFYTKSTGPIITITNYKYIYCSK